MRCSHRSHRSGPAYLARCLLDADHPGKHLYVDRRCGEAIPVGIPFAPEPCILDRDHVGPCWGGPTVIGL